MSDEYQEHTDEVPEDDAFLKAEDPLLNMLVHYAELGAGAGLTLLVGGSMVSGTLVSKRRYVEKSLEVLTEGKSFVANVFKVILEGMGDKVVDTTRPAVLYQHIHLENARVYQDGERALPFNGTMMRMRQSEVSAWHVGVLG